METAVCDELYCRGVVGKCICTQGGFSHWVFDLSSVAEVEDGGRAGLPVLELIQETIAKTLSFLGKYLP